MPVRWHVGATPGNRSADGRGAGEREDGEGVGEGRGGRVRERDVHAMRKAAGRDFVDAERINSHGAWSVEFHGEDYDVEVMAPPDCGL